MRTFLGLLAGVVVGMAVVMAVEFLGVTLFSPPGGLDVTDEAALRAAMDTMPTSALAFVVLAWTLGAVAGTFTAARITRSLLALVAGGLVLAATLFNLASFPHPAWMWVLGLLGVAGGAWLGFRLGAPTARAPA